MAAPGRKLARMRTARARLAASLPLLLLARGALAVRDGEVEGLNLALDTAEKGATASALGLGAGDVLFGEFQLLEFRGTKPLAEAPGGEGLVAAAALLQGEQQQGEQRQSLESRRGFPNALKADYEPESVGAQNDGRLGHGSFGEAWLVKESATKELRVLKLLFLQYQGKAVYITERLLAKGHGGKAVAAASNECSLAQEAQRRAAGIEEEHVRAYAERLMVCYRFSGPSFKDGKFQLRAETHKSEPIYLVLKDCGAETLQEKVVTGTRIDKVTGQTIVLRRFDWLTTPAKAALVVREIAKALLCLRAVRLIHRDLKPENVMVKDDSDGGFSIFVIDFGTVVEHDEQAEFIGTLPFMPPEQLAFEAYLSNDFIPKTAFDMFSLHVIILQMFTGLVWANAGIGVITHVDENNCKTMIFTNCLAKLAQDLKGLEGVVQLLAKKLENSVLREAMKDERFLNTLLSTMGVPLDFVRGLWLKMAFLDPRKRPTPEDVLNHVWVLQGHEVDAPVLEVLNAGTAQLDEAVS